MSPEHDSTPSAGQQAVFATTHWSVVIAATHSDTTQARDALARLCQTYWYPLYAYVRRRGYASHDAQDLTQAFFAQLLERQTLASADPNRGKFRTFILTTINNFLASEWKKSNAQKRGAGHEMLSLDWAAAEERFDLEPATHSSPDKLFDKQWALTLLSEVLDRLEKEYQTHGKTELFTALKQTLTGDRESQPYAELAGKLGIDENAVKVAVHRLRKRYRELIRDEIASTLDQCQDIEAEMRYLFEALAR